jgi:hypothetical protein
LLYSWLDEEIPLEAEESEEEQEKVVQSKNKKNKAKAKDKKPEFNIEFDTGEVSWLSMLFCLPFSLILS